MILYVILYYIYYVAINPLKINYYLVAEKIHI